MTTNNSNTKIDYLKANCISTSYEYQFSMYVEYSELEEAEKRWRRAKNIIINLTQHNATPDQIEAGVEEPNDKRSVQDLLTFDSLPTQEEILARAIALAKIADCSGCGRAMIGGAPYLMGALEKELNKFGIIPVYSFSTRESVDVPQPDGSVKKMNIFKHAGWVVC